MIGTDILHFGQFEAEKNEIEVCMKNIQKQISGYIHFLSILFVTYKTSNSIFLASNWPKCKISVSIM